ncbi:hypothetical protein J8273_6622 [Carpediemonas membranifera]|uniref:LMBR1-like membrane protein n=1 Tax=Carpediemonas membranifera TaxID=201153 RepID=A0A8J6BW36_9EUKA|nr:hypothetical protein J8273_6622 [Carpediemonas membranifera]|eukprot:KAG9392031.1 hypothetical protein J8273_6622 [Carpediemonas membranifera]
MWQQAVAGVAISIISLCWATFSFFLSILIIKRLKTHDAAPLHILGAATVLALAIFTPFLVIIDFLVAEFLPLSITIGSVLYYSVTLATGVSALLVLPLSLISYDSYGIKRRVRTKLLLVLAVLTLAGVVVAGIVALTMFLSYAIVPVPVQTSGYVDDNANPITTIVELTFDDAVMAIPPSIPTGAFVLLTTIGVIVLYLLAGYGLGRGPAVSWRLWRSRPKAISEAVFRLSMKSIKERGEHLTKVYQQLVVEREEGLTVRGRVRHNRTRQRFDQAVNDIEADIFHVIASRHKLYNVLGAYFQVLVASTRLVLVATIPLFLTLVLTDVSMQHLLVYRAMITPVRECVALAFIVLVLSYVIPGLRVLGYLGVGSRSTPATYIIGLATLLLVADFGLIHLLFLTFGPVTRDTAGLSLSYFCRHTVPYSVVITFSPIALVVGVAAGLWAGLTATLPGQRPANSVERLRERVELQERERAAAVAKHL